MIGVTVLIFSLLIPVLYYLDSSILESSFREQLTHISNLTKRSIVQDLETLSKNLRLAFDNPFILNALSKNDETTVRDLLTRIRVDSDLDFIFIMNGDGRITSYTHDGIGDLSWMPRDDILKDILNGRSLTSVRVIEQKLYGIGIVPVGIWDEPRVVIGGRLFSLPKPEKVENYLRNNNIVIYLSDGRPALWNEFADIPLQNMSVSTIERLTSTKGPVFVDHLYGREYGHKVIYGTVLFDDGKRIFYSVHVDASRALASRNRLIHMVLIFMGFSVIAMTLVGVITSRWVSRRVGRLLLGTSEISAGNLGYQLDDNEDDEISEVTKAFNEMSRHLRSSHEWWQVTFDSMTDAVTIHDNNGRTIKANQAAANMVGMPVESMTGKRCCDLFSHEKGAVDGCPVFQCIYSERPVETERHDCREDRWYSVLTSPVMSRDGGVSHVIHIVRDITSRKSSEALVREQLRKLNALYSIDRALNENLDIRSTMELLAEQVMVQLDMDAVSVLLLKRQTQTLEYVVSKGFRSKALAYTSLKIGESTAGRAALEQRIISIPDLRDAPGGFVCSREFQTEKFISYFAVPLVAKGEVNGVMEIFHRSFKPAEPELIKFLETIADQAAIAVDNAMLFDELQRSRNELILAYDSTIVGWSLALDMRDKETEGHSQRVTIMTVQIAQAMGIDDESLVHIRRGALLHDIGKMGIPDSILLKPGRLTPEERSIMEKHTVYAYEMLSEIDYLKPAIDIPYCHHERWDGTGYPRGLRGKEIPLAARIFAVVDVWDALSSDRPYRPAWPKEKVIRYIKENAGTQFDPEVVDVFVRIVENEGSLAGSTET
jgi:PAS domain S-box-containing protein/putative nucleotidyltransferase with HDIG domain